jgi:CRP-like cAMP-binding protein
VISEIASYKRSRCAGYVAPIHTSFERTLRGSADALIWTHAWVGLGVDGREVTYGPGNIFGELEMFSSQPYRAADTISTNASTIVACFSFHDMALVSRWGLLTATQKRIGQHL